MNNDVSGEFEQEVQETARLPDLVFWSKFYMKILSVVMDGKNSTSYKRFFQVPDFSMVSLFCKSAEKFFFGF